MDAGVKKWCRKISCKIGRNRLEISINACHLGYMFERSEVEHDKCVITTYAILCTSKTQLVDALNKDPYKPYFNEQLSVLLLDLAHE